MMLQIPQISYWEGCWFQNNGHWFLLSPAFLLRFILHSGLLHRHIEMRMPLPVFSSTGYKILEANLTSSCNMDCECSPNDLEPICGINGITYFSPCHAGCTRFYNSYTDPDENMKVTHHNKDAAHNSS